jgi:hypothetical protein
MHAHVHADMHTANGNTTHDHCITVRTDTDIICTHTYTRTHTHKRIHIHRITKYNRIRIFLPDVFPSSFFRRFKCLSSLSLSLSHTHSHLCLRLLVSSFHTYTYKTHKCNTFQKRCAQLLASSVYTTAYLMSSHRMASSWRSIWESRDATVSILETGILRFCHNCGQKTYKESFTFGNKAAGGLQ